MPIAAAGLAAVIAFEWLVTGFPRARGAAGLAAHFAHEWVILANLFLLLVGFALLAAHFEQSGLPKALPRFLPDDWTGALALLAIVFVMSGFLDNIAAALIGGAMAHTLFRGRVRVGYLAAIVAASNAGGAGSVIGDTTTTMMWISGVPPIDVLHAYIAAVVAFLVFGVPAARAQQRFAPIIQDARAGARDRLAAGRDRRVHSRERRRGQCRRQRDVPASVAGPVSRASALPSRSRSRFGAWRRPGLERRAGRGQGLALPAVPRGIGVADAGVSRCRRRRGRARSRSASSRPSSTTSR